MSANFCSKMGDLQKYHAPGDATPEAEFALTHLQSQLSELTRSLENCQGEVYEVKQDMMSIKHEIDSVQFVKEEIDDIRDSLDRLECDGERRKAKLLEQVGLALDFNILSRYQSLYTQYMEYNVHNNNRYGLGVLASQHLFLLRTPNLT